MEYFWESIWEIDIQESYLNSGGTTLHEVTSGANEIFTIIFNVLSEKNTPILPYVLLSFKKYV